MRKNTFLLFIFILSLLLTSCNSNKTNYVSEDYTHVTNVFKTDIVSLPDGYKLSYYGYEEITGNFVLVDNDRVHVLCRKDEDYIIYSVDMNNENENIIRLNFNESQVFYSIGILDESTYLARIGNTIYKITDDGNSYYYFTMNELVDDGYVRMDEKIIIYDNYVYIFIRNEIFVYSLEGEYISTISQPDYLYNSYNYNGQLYLNATKEPPDFTYKIEDNKMEKFAVIPAPENVRASSLNDGKSYTALYGLGYDIYYRNFHGIYGYNEGEEEADLLLNWANSDVYEHGMGVYSTQILSIISPEKIVVSMNDGLIKEKNYLCIMTRIPDDEVTPKVHIELAMTSDSDIVRIAAANFNRTNEKYRIVIREYFTKRSREVDPSDLLNLDIGTGDMPDMIITSSNSSTDNYISKGLFVDLYDYVPSAKNIMDGVRYVNETNGKLYKIPISFGINTLVGKKEVVGEKPSMTFDELLELNENLPGDASLVYSLIRSEYIYNMIYSMITEFVNFESNPCDFTTDYFIKVLNYLHNIPNNKYDQHYIFTGTFFPGKAITVPEDYISLFGENKIYLQEIGISVPNDFVYLYHTFGEDYVIKGYPTKEGNGSRIKALLSFGITEKSKVKEGASQFIEYLLSDKIQSNMGSILMSFPVIRENLMNTVKNGAKYYYVSKGFNQYKMAGIGASRELLEYMLEDNIAYELDENYYSQFIECLDNIKVVDRNIDVIYNIIHEELDAYFQDAITAEQCAKYIQNRVSTYLKEQK